MVDGPHLIWLKKSFQQVLDMGVTSSIDPVNIDAEVSTCVNKHI